MFHFPALQCFTMAYCLFYQLAQYIDALTNVTIVQTLSFGLTHLAAAKKGITYHFQCIKTNVFAVVSIIPSKINQYVIILFSYVHENPRQNKILAKTKSVVKKNLQPCSLIKSGLQSP